MELTQLVYVSVRKSTCTEYDINAILRSSQKNNAGLDITGVLLYSDTHFFQYLEGDKGIITDLYERIKDDDRHSNVVLITRTPITSRTFPSWQMAGKRYEQNSIEFQTALSPNERALFRSMLDGDSSNGDRALGLMKKLFKTKTKGGQRNERRTATALG